MAVPLSRIATALGLIALVAVSIFRVLHPPAPVPATAPDTVFSAERALRHVEEIAVRPHPIGSSDHDRVRDYIVRQLGLLGVRAQLQVTTAIGTRYQEAGRVQNILAYIPGSSSNGKAVLLMAHYDGVEAGPAASDDGAGAAALLETVRAVGARRTPLKHDLIVLFTDGEEAGLLGAAAFVREHPWAKDVAFALNFEARGTTGRSFMFETGPGNLDAVRQLRAARDVTAGSAFVTVYRALPNDTDLSELAVLGVPALNFAFADGVERYHTTRDDYAHLNPGSLQHHGQQMLRVATQVADGDLPRPKTGDAVFFDLPLLGLVIYPEWLAVPLALIALVLTVMVVRPVWRDALIGAAAMIVALALSAGVGRLVNLGGAARWSGVYALALTPFVLALNLAVHRIVRDRRENAGSGALLVWLLLSLGTSFAAGGVSYLFTWPLLFAAIAARSRNVVAEWVAAAVAILILANVAYTASAVMLGLYGAGSIALAVLTALLVWLLLPLLQRVASSWKVDAGIAAAAVVVAVLGLITVHQNADHPAPSALVYSENALTHEAWLGSRNNRNAWTRSVLQSSPRREPEWTSSVDEFGVRLTGRPVPPARLAAPTLTYIRDTIIDNARRVVFRVNAPRGTTAVVVRASGAPVGRAAIDARVVDTTRFRYRLPGWQFEFWNVPDSGAVFSLAVPPGRQLDVDASARRMGLPAIAGVTIPRRPPDVVPAQTGDISVVYTRLRF
jgi:hypothetical protein